MFSIAVLWPNQKGWTFVVSAKILLEDHTDVQERNSAPALHRYLAERLEVYYDQNEERLERLFQFFTTACALLALNIFLWLLELVVD